jgi:DnaK suppressor protein
MNEPPAHLTAEQEDQLRDQLLRSLKRLKISGQAARPVTLDQTSVGRLSRIDALQNQQMTQGLEARENARYAQITEALQRLERGTYGVCAGCEQPIPFELADGVPRNAAVLVVRRGGVIPDPVNQFAHGHLSRNR